MANGNTMPRPLSLIEDDRAPAGGEDLLTPRQAEIIGLVSTGLSNKEIADRLGLTDGTVKQHLAAIFRRLGVSNRTWAVNLWRQIDTRRSADDKLAPVVRPFSSQLTVQNRKETGASVHGVPPRLIAAVTISQPSSVRKPSSNADIAAFRASLACCTEWATALEGQLEVAASGSITALFGFPVAHIDDLDRALAFARTVHRQLVGRQKLSLHISVDACVDALLASDEKLVSCTAAAGSLAAAITSQSGNILISPRVQALLRTASARRANFSHALSKAPFVRDMLAALAAGRACWLSVEAWPILSGHDLLNGWSECPPFSDLRTLVLRWPTNCPDAVKLAADLAAQIAPQAPDFRPPGSMQGALGGWLLQLAQDAPLIVLVHGVSDVASFRALLGEEVLEGLSNVPIAFVVGPLPLRGSARLVVRSLGATGNVPLIARAHEITLTSDNITADGDWPDIVALLDQVDDNGKAILLALRRYQRCTPQFLAHRLAMAPALLETSLARLAQLGLISMTPDHISKIRDPRTERAVDDQLQSITNVI